MVQQQFIVKQQQHRLLLIFWFWIASRLLESLWRSKQPSCSGGMQAFGVGYTPLKKLCCYLNIPEPMSTVITWTRKGNVVHRIKYQISTKRDGNLFAIWVSKNRTKILKLKVPRMKLVVFRIINLFTNITYFHVSTFFDFLIF